MYFLKFFWFLWFVLSAVRRPHPPSASAVRIHSLQSPRCERSEERYAGGWKIPKKCRVFCLTLFNYKLQRNIQRLQKRLQFLAS